LSGQTITVNTTSPLGVGTYTIIQQASGSVSQSGSFIAAGTAIPGNCTGAISFSGGNVNLVITSTATPTATTLNSLSAIAYGDSVTFTATVSPTPDGGTVQFYDNGVALGSPVTITSGTTSLTTSALTAGNHPITAGFSGTSAFVASSSSSSTQTVNQKGVTITSGLSIADKTWNGTTAATIISNNVVLNGVLPADTANVSLSTNSYTANFTSPNIGTTVPVTVSGLSLAGTAGGNYSLTQPPSLTGNILFPVPATLMWDANGATAPNPNDGSGSWTNTGNWFVGGINTNWIEGSSAVFGAGTSGSYLVDLNGGNFSPTNLTFNTSGYTLTNGSVTVTATTGNPITVSNNIAATVSCLFTNTVANLIYYVANGGTLNFAGGGSFAGGNTEFSGLPGGGSGGTGTVDFQSGIYAGNYVLWTQINANQEAATLNISRLLVGYGGNSTFTINSPSALITGNGSGGNNLIGRSGATGILDLKQGTVTMTNSGNEMRIVFDNQANSQGTLTVEGGTFNLGSTVNNIFVNHSGTSANNAGTFNLSGGMVTARSVLLGGGGAYTSGSTAAFNVTGGTLYVGAGGMAINPTNTGTLASSIVLSGGTIGAAAAWSSASPMTLTNLNGNITFQAADSGANAQNITLSGVLSGTLGGLTKTGAGTLTLNNADTYSGVTVIANGTLALGSSGSIANTPLVSVGNGATFDVSGRSTTFALGYNQTLTNISGTGLLAGNVNLSSGALALNYTNGTPSLSVANGTLAFSGNAVTVNVSGSLAHGIYKLISTNTGGLVTGTLPATVTVNGDLGPITGSLSLSNNEIYLIVNHPPVASPATYYRAKGLSLKIPIAELLTNATDADGDTISLQGVGTGLTNATILTDNTYIYYLPGTGGGSNDNDIVSYTVRDGFGGTAVANILVNVFSAAGPSQMSIPTNGVVNIHFFGIPNYTYVVQTTTNLNTPWWTLSTNTAGSDGSWQFTDLNATNDQQYYRTAQP
jgi:autotransporter-associated beta strand protein